MSLIKVGTSLLEYILNPIPSLPPTRKAFQYSERKEMHSQTQYPHNPLIWVETAALIYHVVIVVVDPQTVEFFTLVQSKPGG